MRAWLLLLAVLATSHTFVQVASTEDITSTFITAILPVVEPRIQTVEVTNSKHTQLHKSNAPLTHRASESTNTNANALATTSTATTTTALARAFSAPSHEISEYQSQLPTTVSLRTTINSPSQSKRSLASNALLYANSESDNQNMLNNIATDNVIIEIKNYEEYEGKHNSDVSVPTESVTKPHRTNQSEVAKSNQNQTSIKQKNINISHNKPKKYQHDKKHTNSAVQVVATSEIIVQKEQTEQLQNAKASHSTSLPPLSSPSSAAKADPVPSNSIDSSTSNDEASENRLSSTSSPSSPHNDDDDDDNASVHDDENSEPATYSNKEIIGQKVKPDPSTLVEIENSLLSLFNMKRPPKIDRSKIIIPEAMKQLYAEIMGHEFDSVNIPKPGLLTRSANTVRSFTHQNSKIDDRFPHHHRFRLHFDINSIPNEEKLKAAELQLSRDAVSHAVLNARQSNRTRYQVLVYDITRVGVRGKKEPSYLLLDTKTVRLNSTETVSLDVQPAVDRWLATPKRNFGLLVEVRTMRALKPAPHHHVRLRRSADEPHDDWQHKQPLLFTYTDDGRHKSRSIRDVSTRSKRAGHRRPHRRKNTEENCRRHSLYVDFSDVGWNDWIVAPQGYDAYYCHGKCPFPLAEHLNSTNHAVVQTLVNNIHPGKVPKACCVPTQLEGISMLYLNDQHTVVLKNYQDMTVVGCGCR